MKRFLKRNAKGSLVLIGSLLIGSGAIRIGLEAGQAVATESPFLATEQNLQPNQEEKPVQDRAELSNLLIAFQKREERISKAERQLAVREKALEVADQEIERRLATLKSAEEALQSVLSLADSAAEDDLIRLTSVYENMKPKEAALLFEEMDPAFAAGFLGRMRPDAAAGVMAGLSPQAAYLVSVILAGRNADIPSN